MNAADRQKAAAAMVAAMDLRDVWHRLDLYAYGRGAGLSPAALFEVAAHAVARGWVAHVPADDDGPEAWVVTDTGRRKVRRRAAQRV